jgi:predicted nucleic acid-binding protein
MIFDTDVLIWFLKGHPAAAKVVAKAKTRAISILTYMELLQGARSREEMRLIKRLIRDLHFALLPLSENIGHRASIYIEEYALKGGLRLADALIAATAVENQVKLCSGDQRHYRQIKDLDVQIFRA